MVQVAKKHIQSKTEYEEEKTLQSQRLMKQMQKETEEQEATDLAKRVKLPYLDLNLMPISKDDILILTEDVSRKYNAAVFQKVSREIKIATPDPENPEMREFFSGLEKEKGWEVHYFVVSKSSLEKIWKAYKDTPLLENLDLLHMSLSGEDLKEFEKNFGDLLNLKERMREISTSQILTIIMAGSLKMKASDIHFESQEKEARLRFRIDGMLQDIGNLPHDIYNSVVSRIKMMGKMKINLKDIAQDGHFSIKLSEMEEKKDSQDKKKNEDSRLDLRVSIIPGKLGESIVMRLLDQSAILLGVEDLGLRGLAYEQVKKQVEKPNGILLTTGPTGSGKTTTLYALINKLNTPDLKIITIEDPVEYQVKGISQTQINKDRGYTFADGLRAIVRQDPDVILVGEIRDEETAAISLNAALTGHLVLSTIHTNNAAATVPRLIEMGIKPNLIPPAVNAFIGQRLVRKLCPHCREKHIPSKETLDSIKKILSIISPKAAVEIPKDLTHLYKPAGCPKCHGLGYKGRIGIFEVFTVDETIEKLILEMASETELAKAALEEGMITMAQDGILKAAEGLTSLEEVWQATGQTQFLEDLYEKLMAQSLSRAIHVLESDLENLSKNASSFEKIDAFIHKLNQKDVLKYVFASALLLETGDIHIEPTSEAVKIRFRIDGILQTVGTIPLEEYPIFLGEIKILSGFKAEVRGGVKDSRFSIALEKPYKNITETKVDVRVSIILGGFGETVVMRLLNKSAIALNLESLGIRKQNFDKILNEIKKPNGVFLNTGPTGSGKTTTVYSILGILNNPEVKIITVEDPIEYQLEGILQTQVNNEEGYTFATALRALMRQNPDIITIGEIRDKETAEIAIEAALTGHFVLSTLHTNDAAGTVQRLLNMGVRPIDLATASNAFMAQRLVRKLCDCKEKVEPSKEEKEKINQVIATISPKAGVTIPKIDYIFKPKGCDKCKNIGYKGRTTLTEIVVVDKDIEELISKSALSSEIKDKAIENGMISLLQDGMLKVLEGETSFEEVERVARE